MTEYPDPARSRAVLIGASRFPSAPGLPEIPAVRANLVALRRSLTDSTTGVLERQHCVVVEDPETIAAAGTVLGSAAADATDLLLVYYAGHGLVDDHGRLHLALATTIPSQLRFTSLSFNLLREELANSAATTRVLVLDCCFSGRAVEAMADDQGVITAQLDVAGTYTLTSTTANAPSHAPTGQLHTAFTGALLRALNNPDPLTLDEVYQSVDRDLVSRGLPRPQCRAVNAAGNLALSRGPRTQDWTDEDNPTEVRFGFDKSSRWRAASFLPFGYVFTAGIMALLSPSSWQSIATSVGVAYFVPFVIVMMYIPPRIVVDRLGIAFHHGRKSTTIPWQRIASVGVFGPKPGSVTPRFKAAYEKYHILVVRLRPDSPDIPYKGILSRELQLLGYLGLCKVWRLGTSSTELVAALGQFAGGRLVRSHREWLDLDPKLRPDML